ncbi:MAG: hypothetical protein M0Z66_00530 [Thermaerobacter sp.]|nr:hypothetical protein [Thermaerobacter sp.]
MLRYEGLPSTTPIAEGNTIFDEEAISEFYDRDLITDVIGQLKAGKEAQVFVCRAHPKTGYDLLAAKLYRPREQRGFRSEAPYLEGRGSLRCGRARDSSVTRAIDRRSRAGKTLLSETWVRREYDVLHRLKREGVQVPAPVACTEHAVLMQYLGDEHAPAPRLLAQSLTAGEAAAFRAALLEDVERCLRAGLIHGDLSPYNVLVFQGAPWIIDLPQAVDAAVHPDGRSLLRRDVTNLTRHFARHGIPDDGADYADALWEQYERGRI